MTGWTRRPPEFSNIKTCSHRHVAIPPDATPVTPPIIDDATIFGIDASLRITFADVDGTVIPVVALDLGDLSLAEMATNELLPPSEYAPSDLRGIRISHVTLTHVTLTRVSPTRIEVTGGGGNESLDFTMPGLSMNGNVLETSVTISDDGAVENAPAYVISILYIGDGQLPVRVTFPQGETQWSLESTEPAAVLGRVGTGLDTLAGFRIATLLPSSFPSLDGVRLSALSATFSTAARRVESVSFTIAAGGWTIVSGALVLESVSATLDVHAAADPADPSSAPSHPRRDRRRLHTAPCASSRSRGRAAHRRPLALRRFAVANGSQSQRARLGTRETDGADRFHHGAAARSDWCRWIGTRVDGCVVRSDALGAHQRGFRHNRRVELAASVSPRGGNHRRVDRAQRRQAVRCRVARRHWFDERHAGDRPDPRCCERDAANRRGPFRCAGGRRCRTRGDAGMGQVRRVRWI